MFNFAKLAIATKTFVLSSLLSNPRRDPRADDPFSLLLSSRRRPSFPYRFSHLVSPIQHSGIVGFLLANFATGPGVTGWIMTAALGIMVWFAMEKRRKAPGKFERFWYTHHVSSEATSFFETSEKRTREKES